MDFRLRKLRLSLVIIAAGLVLALVWHGIQGWGLGRGYPHNTFLFSSGNRYSDFIQCVQDARLPGIHSHYFPSTNLLFYLFGCLPVMPGTFLFLNLCVIALYVALNDALRSPVPGPVLRATACVVFLWSYPVLYCLDRGNIEILLAALMAASLLLYSRKKFAASFFTLLPAICFKLYPAILLLLFFRRRLLGWAFLGVAGFVVLNGAVFLAAAGTIDEKLAAYSFEFNAYTHSYIIGSWGESAAGNAWNLFRIGVWAVASTISGDFTWPMPEAEAMLALHVYEKLFLVLAALIALFTLLVETSFARRAMLLLLYLTVSAPTGGDYKLVHVGIALVVLIVIPQRRPADLMITAALALCLVPQREVILTFLDPSDSGYRDAPLGVITYPLCILTSMALLIRDGWCEAAPIGWRRRFVKLLHVFHVDNVRA